MRTNAGNGIVIKIGVAVLPVFLLVLVATPAALAGQAPSSKVCNDTVNPPKSNVTQGGCIALSRHKGYCQSCHAIPGVDSGDIAPALTNIARRFPDRARLRTQIENPARYNPATIMPPFGKHEILSADEIDKVVEWLLTL